MALGSAKSLKAQAGTVMADIGDIQAAIKSSDFDGAAATAQNLKSTAGDMRAELSSPLWAAASALPVVGQDVKNVQVLADVLVDASGNALVPLTDSLKAAPPTSLVTEEGNLNVASITALLGSVQQAAPAMQRCADSLSSMPAMSIGQLEAAVSKAREKIVPINDLFQKADMFAPLAGAMLGANGDRAYLIAAQNSAETRAAGGFPGSMGVLNLRNGDIELGDFASVYDVMDRALPAGTAISDEEYALFGGFMDSSWDTGFNPDFSRVAKIWADSYNQYNGASVDGVVSVTPSIVQDLLAIVGPITLSDGTQLDGTNATRVLESDLYWRYLSADARSAENADKVDALFAEAADLAFKKLVEGMNSDSMAKVAKVFVDGMGTREIMLWLADESEQAQLDEAGFSCGLNHDPANPKVGTFLNLWIGSKLGWYLDIDTSIGEGVENPDGTTTYQVRTSFVNNVRESEVAPGGPYIMGGLEGYESGNMTPYLYLYAPAGGSISNVVSSNGEELAVAEYGGLQVHYLQRTSLPPESSIVIDYAVTVSAQAQSPLEVMSVPTLTQYRNAA